MEKTKGLNMFLTFTAFFTGITVFRHFNFSTFEFKDTKMDLIYLGVFILATVLIIRDLKRMPK